VIFKRPVNSHVTFALRSDVMTWDGGKIESSQLVTRPTRHTVMSSHCISPFVIRATRHRQIRHKLTHGEVYSVITDQ